MKKRLDKNQTTWLTSIVKLDNDKGCKEFFWSKPIDSDFETKDLSELTLWKAKGKYVSNQVNIMKYSQYKVGPSGTKDVPIEKAIEVKSNSKNVKYEKYVVQLKAKKKGYECKI